MSTSTFIRTLTYHNNLTQQKWSSARLSFSHHVSLHKIAHQKVEELSFFSKIWWDDDLKFDEMTLSSSLIKWRFSLSSLMSRFHQVWWVVLVKFNEISQQIWRLIINVARQIENKHTSLDNREWACVIRQDEIRRSEKLTTRWLSMITRMNRLKQSLQKRNLNRISQITSHTSRQNAKHVISIFSQQLVSIFTASKFLLKKVH